MKKSVIIGCQGEAIFCEEKDIDFISFTMGKIIEEELIGGKLEEFQYLTRVCNISIKGNIITLKTELVGIQMIEAQEIFEETGNFPLGIKDLEISKKRLPLIKEFGDLVKIYSTMEKNRWENYRGHTLKSIEQRLESINKEIEKNKLSIEIGKKEGIDA